MSEYPDSYFETDTEQAERLRIEIQLERLMHDDSCPSPTQSPNNKENWPVYSPFFKQFEEPDNEQVKRLAKQIHEECFPEKRFKVSRHWNRHQQ